MAEETIAEDLRKEDFDTGMTDDELIRQIKDWEIEGEDSYAELKRIQDMNERYYRGIQTDVRFITGRKESTAVENRIFMATETMIPIATSRLPDIEVRAASEDELDQRNADDLKNVVNYHFERIGIQEKAEQFLRYMIIYRFGVWGPVWNKELDDVELDVIHPRRVRIPMFGKSVDELAFVMVFKEMSYGQISDVFGKDKANEVLREAPLQQNVETSSPSETDVSVSTTGIKSRRKTFTIQEVWTDHFVAWRIGNIILEKKENPFYNFKSKKANFFDHPKKPFIIKSLFQTRDSLIGDTDYIQTVIPIQDNINIVKRRIENLIRKVANAPLLIDSDTMSEEQASGITNDEGMILYGKGAADPNKIRFETPGQVPNYLFEELMESRAQFDNIWGIHSTTRGERQGKETLGGRQLLKQADLGRIDLIARQLERAMDETAEWFTQLFKMFYTEEKAFSIIGEDGRRFVQNFKNDRINPGVKPQVVAGTTLPKDEVSQRQEAIELWQNSALGIRTLYRKLKMSNIDDAIEDYIETQSGAILQGGGGQGGQPPAQLPTQ